MQRFPYSPPPRRFPFPVHFPNTGVIIGSIIGVSGPEDISVAPYLNLEVSNRMIGERPIEKIMLGATGEATLFCSGFGAGSPAQTFTGVIELHA